MTVPTLTEFAFDTEGICDVFNVMDGVDPVVLGGDLYLVVLAVGPLNGGGDAPNLASWTGIEWGDQYLHYNPAISPGSYTLSGTQAKIYLGLAKSGTGDLTFTFAGYTSYTQVLIVSVSEAGASLEIAGQEESYTFGGTPPYPDSVGVDAPTLSYPNGTDYESIRGAVIFSTGGIDIQAIPPTYGNHSGSFIGLNDLDGAQSSGTLNPINDAVSYDIYGGTSYAYGFSAAIAGIPYIPAFNPVPKDGWLIGEYLMSWDEFTGGG